ncbi:hypothetical protein CLOP_g23293, partial [Closterium sp. NIES-67]
MGIVTGCDICLARKASQPKKRPASSSQPSFDSTASHPPSFLTATRSSPVTSRLQVSAAYHPETVGQTERANQTMEQLN